MTPFHYLLPGNTGAFIRDGRPHHLNFRLAHLAILYRVQRINVQYSTHIAACGWWGGQTHQA